jgi:hypothetical protein
MQHPNSRALPSFTPKKFRLLSKHDAAQPCATPACGKSAKGEYLSKVYCGVHFFAIIQQQWI